MITPEQQTAIAAYDPTFESRVLSGDIYLRKEPGFPVLRIDPDGNEHYPAAWPTKGISLREAKTTEQVVRRFVP